MSKNSAQPAGLQEKPPAAGAAVDEVIVDMT